MDPNQKKMRVAVIGLAISGVQAMKSCLELDVEPTGFEKDGDLGGFWRYKPNHGQRSVYQSTHIDSGRDLNSYGDRPFSPDDPVIVHNTKLIQYLRDNFAEYNLEKYARFNTEVNMITPIENSNPTQKVKWRVESTQTLKNGTKKKRSEVFDGVMICTGRHSRPWTPTDEFPGLQNFKGNWIHSSQYKHAESHDFTNKNICVVGIGNSGADISTELSQQNKQVYLVARHGVWAIDVGGEDGFRGIHGSIASFVTGGGTRLIQTQVSAQPWEARSAAIERRFNKKHIRLLDKHNLTPDHRFLSAHPTATGIADKNNTIYTALEKGHMTAKRGIRRITQNGIIFVDSDEEIPIDGIVFATGYRQAVDFLDPNVVDMRYNRDGENTVPLYKNMLPMNDKELKYTTLGFIAFVQSATFMCADLHSRYFVRQLLGQVELPSWEQMHIEHDALANELSNRFYKSNRHNIQEGLVLEYYDDIAKSMGCYPYPETLLKERPEALWAAWFTPWTSVQYRLVGPGALPEAEEWIRKCHETTSLKQAPENWADGKYWAEKIKRGLSRYGLLEQFWSDSPTSKL